MSLKSAMSSHEQQRSTGIKRSEVRQTDWVLAGGLNAENIGDAIAATGARFVDVNNGVEAAPGRKDPEKLKVFAAALARSVKPPARPAAE